MSEFKEPKKADIARSAASFNLKIKPVKSSGGAYVMVQNYKSGRFMDGVKIVSKRDRDGLIKLADR